MKRGSGASAHRHSDASNSHDVARLISLFADHCVFEASAGPEFPAVRLTMGRRARVEAAFVEVFDSMPDANWGSARRFVISSDYGVSERGD